MGQSITPARILSLADARLVWHTHQLGKAVCADPFSSVPGGWMRSLGAAEPYLAMLARSASLSRGAVDAALADQVLWVLPGVRGCIWLVPRQDASLALSVGTGFFNKRQRRELEKLGVSATEMDDVGTAVLGLLQAGPKTPETLRAALPEGLVRSLGAAGKKKGHNTNLPGALRILENGGKIIRRLLGGGLDTQRYEWALANLDPLSLGEAPTDTVDQAVALAGRFFRWAGVATLDEFATWSGLGKRVCKSALESVSAVPVQIEGRDEMSWMLPDDFAALDASIAAAQSDGRLHLLPTTDNLMTLRAHPTLLADARHHQRDMIAMGSRLTPMSKSSWVNIRTVIKRGEWIGLWVWDPTADEVVVAGFDPLSTEDRRLAQQTGETVAVFIRNELSGVAKTVSIDGEKSINRRVAFVRQMLT